MDIYVLSVFDTDGYLNPIVAGNSEGIVKREFVEFKEDNENNDFLDFDLGYVISIVTYYEK